MVKRDWENYVRPCENGGVAQLGEHLPCKQGVRSSILLISTTDELFKWVSKENFKSFKIGSLGGGNSTEDQRLDDYGLVAQVVRAYAW